MPVHRVVMGCSSRLVIRIAGAAGAGDERLDCSLVDHASVVADVDNIVLPVKVNARNMRIGTQRTLDRIGAFRAMQIVKPDRGDLFGVGRCM
jgi:hypothetical protein